MWMELQGLEGMLVQAWAATFDTASGRILALHMFAKDLMCFIPYWDSDPHCASKARTWRKYRGLLSMPLCKKRKSLSHDAAATIVNKRFTVDLRQLQSSTKGSPAARTAFRTLGPSSEPKRRLPISSTLLSTWDLWDITSSNSFRASFFPGEPSANFRYFTRDEEANQLVYSSKQMQKLGKIHERSKEIF